MTKKLTVTHLKKSIESGQNNSHGEIIWIDEVECLCHGNEDLIIHTRWYTLHIQTNVCSSFEPSSQNVQLERQHATRSRSAAPAGMYSCRQPEICAPVAEDAKQNRGLDAPLLQIHSYKLIICYNCKAEQGTTSTTALMQIDSTCLLLHPLADSELVLPLNITLTLYNGWQQA